MVKRKLAFKGACEDLIILVTDPSISAAITGSDDGAIAGQNYTLECGVSGADMLLADITYEWTRGSSSVKLGGNMTYTFTPTAGDDGVIYHCAATVTSGLLNTPITRNVSVTISVSG